MVVNHRMAVVVRVLLLVSGAVMLSACTTAENHAQHTDIKIDPSIIAVSTPGTKIRQGATFAWLAKAINLYKDERLDNTTIQYLIEQNIKANLALSRTGCC